MRGLLTAALVALSLGPAVPCERRVLVAGPDRIGNTTYYWHEIAPTTVHGICAAMYSNKVGTLWVVEKPWGAVVKKDMDGSPVIMSARTEVQEFKTRPKAEAWIEQRCSTKNKHWKVVN